LTNGETKSSFTTVKKQNKNNNKSYIRPAWAEGSKKVRKTPENFPEDWKMTRKRAAKNNVMR
jgi:hypothetical protein